MGSPRKILFLIPALPVGGAERVMIQILRRVDRSRFNPHLVLFQRSGAFLDHVPGDVDVHPLVPRKYYFLMRWLVYFKYKKCVSRLRPDVVVSFMWYPNFIALLEKRLSRVPRKVIVCEHSTLSFTKGGRLIGLIRKWMIRLSYPAADRVIALTGQMRQELMAGAPLSQDRVKVVHNPADIHELETLSKEPVDQKWFNPSVPLILSIGRLTIEKGFDHLIRAFSQIDGSHPARLVILGEGEERGRLEGVIHQLGIGEKVCLPGLEKNPYKYLAHSTLFVLSSNFEGFPNVLIEAMALGVPCIATRCPTGPEEIITDGVDGLLVPPGDEKALAAAMTRLLKNATLRHRLSETGKRRAGDFEVKKIVKEYEDLISSV
jgi:glycosyltransferase involved in cell wall biosynthesis